MRLILRYGAVLAVVGAAIGLVLGFLLERLLHAAVPRWVSLELASIGGTAAILFVVALMACFVPAFRATRINPLNAMRAE